MSELGRPQQSKHPAPITAEEFDRKVEAGENIDDYIDWESGVMVEPGEISPGQRLAMEKEAAEDQLVKSSQGDAEESLCSLSVSLPSWAFDQLQSDASRQGIRQEELARLLILQRLDKQRSTA